LIETVTSQSETESKKDRTVRVTETATVRVTETATVRVTVTP